MLGLTLNTTLSAWWADPLAAGGPSDGQVTSGPDRTTTSISHAYVVVS